MIKAVACRAAMHAAGDDSAPARADRADKRGEEGRCQ